MENSKWVIRQVRSWNLGIRRSDAGNESVPRWAEVIVSFSRKCARIAWLDELCVAAYLSNDVQNVRFYRRVRRIWREWLSRRTSGRRLAILSILPT